MLTHFTGEEFFRDGPAILRDIAEEVPDRVQGAGPPVVGVEVGHRSMTHPAQRRSKEVHHGRHA
ncbi:hypothetical protein [Kitasatospora sp. NPDC088346]|uniref:hypothetical protein n=1 Tax=Kitasatospora sp. NPDC088346 TaxID=3364073 RepID=UPI00380B7546